MSFAVLRVLIWILAFIFSAETIYCSLTANLTAGLILLYLITFALIGAGIFYHPLMNFFSFGVGRWIKWLLIFGTTVYVGLMIFLALGVPAAPNGTEQAIVVLGAGLQGEKVSSTLRYRLDAAREYFYQHPELPIVVTGGQGPQELCSEALAMKKYLVENGVPEESILMEDQSTSTLENFRFARKVLEENGYGKVDRIVFVTNRFHCYRAGLIAERVGLSVSAVPASISLTALLPCYLREVLAVLYYWILHRG